MAEIAKANANASRAFFVRMLTRDITIEDCILDLVDNSVDSAWKSLGAKRLGLKDGPDFSNVKIDLTINGDEFRIKDNCGGMSLDSAKKYAFTFGRKVEDPEDDGEYSIGVYGIGLKRAIFKLGADIKIRSTHRKANKVESFEIPIQVNTWVKGTSTDWDFPINDAPALPSNGLDIHVKDLTDLARVTFEDTDFEGLLEKTIARDYSLHIHRGLQITVNGSKVKGEIFQVYSGGEFEPLYDAYEERVGDDIINIEILAGFAFPPPEDNDPTERKEREEKSGWYVACNGRIVMAADKSSLSVWGDDFPTWHYQYTGFFGIILFSADNTELLPLTTTKRSVDLSSIVYRRSRPKMKEPTRTWIDYTNARKNEQQAAKVEEQKATQQPIFAAAPRAQVALPRIKKSRVKETSIQFKVLTERVKKLAAGFGSPSLTGSEVGRKAFEYAYDDHVVEE